MTAEASDLLHASVRHAERICASVLMIGNVISSDSYEFNRGDLLHLHLEPS